MSEQSEFFNERYHESFRKTVEENKQLKAENIELKTRLEEYEKYGGVIDEGKAWAEEAMASREKLKKIEEIVSGNYELLDPQAKQDILQIIRE